MAYTPSSGTDFVTTMIKGMPFTDVRVRVADAISKIMWQSAPFRWTVGSLDPAITLVSNTSDYTFTKPSDFLHLLTSYIWDGQGETPLDIEASLPTDGGQAGKTSRIAHVVVSSVDKLRLYPNPIVGSGTKKLISMYKKTAPTIDATTILSAGALGIPDEYAWVFEAGCLWLGYLYADDRRAGSAVITSDGRIQYTEQLGTFMSGIEFMKHQEKLISTWPGKPGTN